MKQQHVSITIASRIGQSPIYPRNGQGLLGGTIVSVRPGDSEAAHNQLDEMRQIFSEKFDRGELSSGMLERVLWESNWWHAILPVVKGAADMLHLASASGISEGGLAARRCAELEAALNAMTRERIPETPIGDALLRGEPIPAGHQIPPITCDLSSAEDRKLALTEILRTSLQADGIRPTALLTSDESHALADQIRSTADAVEAVGALGENTQQIGGDSNAGAGSRLGEDDSPFAVYEFPHEMYTALRRVSETVGGIREVEKQGLAPTPEMLKVCAKVLSDVDELLGRIDGASCTYRPTVLTDKKMVEEAMRYRDEQERLASEDKRLALLEDTVVKTGHVTLDRLERLERGLMGLAKAFGSHATERTLAAMERPV